MITGKPFCLTFAFLAGWDYYPAARRHEALSLAGVSDVFAYRAKDWNDLPCNIREALNHAAFVQALKDKVAKAPENKGLRPV